MIIGLTGSLAAGKEVVSEFFIKKDFVYFSLSQEVRNVAKERGIELTRKNLQDLGNELRETEGIGVLAKRVLNKIKADKNFNFIIDGIRNPAEINVLKKLDNFLLIAVDAPKEIRFNRFVKRNRESDPKTWDGFLKVDARDKGEGESKTGQGVGKCMEKADFTLENNGTLEEIQNKVNKLYNKIKNPTFTNNQASTHYAQTE